MKDFRRGLQRMAPMEEDMRTVGRRKVSEFGLRGPTAAEIQASVENSERAPRVFPKGVYRYRNHQEANAQMEKWLADGMVKRSLELDGQKDKS